MSRRRRMLELGSDAGGSLADEAIGPIKPRLRLVAVTLVDGVR
jgi:hypothetical protein